MFNNNKKKKKKVFDNVNIIKYNRSILGLRRL